MIKKNLILIETPFQLLNAAEAIATFPAKQIDLYIRYSDASKNDAQLKNLLETIKLPNHVHIKTFFIGGEKRSMLDAIKIALYFLHFKITLSTYQRVFIGNYESRLIKWLIPYNEKIILLDDGLKTIRIQKQFTPEKHFDWFTIFDLAPINEQKIYKNELTTVQTRITEHPDKKKTILFIGAKLSEEKIIDEDYNIEIIKRVTKDFRDAQITYVAHRGENQAKLNKIQQIKNFEVVQLTYPLELLPIYGDFSPSVIISFYSTALITLNKIYKTETISYKFDFSQSIHKDNIQSAYEYCAQFFTVKELPL